MTLPNPIDFECPQCQAPPGERCRRGKEGSSRRPFMPTHHVKRTQIVTGGFSYTLGRTTHTRLFKKTLKRQPAVDPR